MKTKTFLAVVVVAFSIHAHAQSPTLRAQFTSTPIIVDGIAEPAWNQATPSHIAIAMNPDLSAIAANCATSGDVRALWDGSLLYLLISVNDADITTASDKSTDKDGVEVYIDLFNDKMSKFEEDDGMMRISAPPASFTGNIAQNNIYPAIYSDRLKAHASAYRLDAQGKRIGYNVELAFNIGGRPMNNGTAIGMEFAINDASSASNTRTCRIFWSSGNNHGVDDNSMWGMVVLSGYDRKSAKILDTYGLNKNIEKADVLTRGIWQNEDELDKALTSAKAALINPTQAKIDSANSALTSALTNLRRKGKYPDPYDLPAINYLPDPFTLFNGKKVKSRNDWNRRREEIKDHAQYYEYGYLPPAPQSITAIATPSSNFTTIVVTVEDHGKTASFNAGLTLPTAEQSASSGKSAPYPIIVSLDVVARPGNATYLNAGYAVLSVPTYAFASDNINHTGAFFTLYPYDLATGHDAGVLMAWGWGASRGVDALEYLAAHDPKYKNLLDLKKLAVTGFSRWGKAALVTGLLDERFGVVNPGGSGSGGAAPYRYDSYGNQTARNTFGNIYPWGRSTGAEVLPDHELDKFLRHGFLRQAAKPGTKGQFIQEPLSRRWNL